LHLGEFFVIDEFSVPQENVKNYRMTDFQLKTKNSKLEKKGVEGEE
jgi:hypothetical protein